MLDKIIIVDFEDSFTHNIASALYSFENNITVISHQLFFSSTIKMCLSSRKKHAVILGPGPGHPELYKAYFAAIRVLREQENIYVMGICLGHQLLGLMDGIIIANSREQIHGRAVEVDFKGTIQRVQRYNSLALYEDDKEVDIRYFTRGISYQFHPESIGTEHSEIFFQDLLLFTSSG